MNKLIALLFIVAVVSADLALKDQFDSFLTTYSKKYTGAEYHKRLAVYSENMRAARRIAASSPNAQFGETKYSDLTHEEFSDMMFPAVYDSDELATACLKKGVFLPTPTAGSSDVPDSFDWRDTDGVVTEVKDQAQCGSCWAFSTAAVVEGQVGIKQGSTPSFSPQYLMDCSKGCTSEIYQDSNTTVCNDACNGGWAWTAFNDITNDLGGIPDWDTFPYKEEGKTCPGLSSAKTVATLKGYKCITQADGVSEEAMMEALVENGPLGIAVDANLFSFYQSGVFHSSWCSSSYVNHAILLVGYGTDETAGDYWIIKNSWGSDWGEDGYIRLQRGTNMCGVTEGVSVAVLDEVITN